MSKVSGNLNKNYLIEQLKILYSTHRDSIDIYNKATAFWLLLSMTTLGFIFKGEITFPFSEILSGIMLIVGIGWITGNVLMIGHIKRLEIELKNISSLLGIDYLSVAVYPTKVGQKIAFVCGTPIVVLFLFIFLGKLFL